MKRTVALWAAVSTFILMTWAVDVRGQYQPPPPPTRDAPPDAPPDTLGAGAEVERTPPGQQVQPAPADTMTAAARIRRAQSSQMTYVISLGLGSSINQEPPAFIEEFDPSFGLYLDGGVRRWEFELTLSFDYNFFFTTRPDPEDLSIMNLFLNLKYRPLKTTARPYVLVCGGLFRSWIVNELDPNDPPETVEYEVESGDNFYEENVLGFGIGGGVEIEMDKTRRIFFEGRYVQGQTRQTEDHANMAIIPVRIGVTWEF
ncbi:MAG: porin family protein [Candidatus Latescibacteria bacterium]|nr:porin family protein [Candidatus Latescibacterota bacterium]